MFVDCRRCHRSGRLDGGRLVGLAEGSYHETQFVGDFCQEGFRRMHYRPMVEPVGCCDEEERLLELGGVDQGVRPVLEERIEFAIVRLHEQILKTSFMTGN